jgi:methionine sulfoxide reductase heme-binding subunit
MALSESKSARRARRFVVGWKTRHLGALLIGALVTYGFLELRSTWSAMHQWNRATGDASVVLISLSMSIGPLSRLWPRVRWLLPWRREFGAWGVVLAAVHTAIILAGWVEWDMMRLAGFAINPQTGQFVMVQHGFGLANAIGIVALIYGIVLGATSNDRSQNALGGAVWKFLQQSAYVLWILIVVHTAYFLYMHFLDFHRPVPAPNRLQIWFAVMVALVAGFQFAAFLATWRTGRRRAVRAGL